MQATRTDVYVAASVVSLLCPALLVWDGHRREALGHLAIASAMDCSNEFVLRREEGLEAEADDFRMRCQSTADKRRMIAVRAFD
jgi:hypothetical protein